MGEFLKRVPADPETYRVEDPIVAEKLAYAGDTYETPAAEKIAWAAGELSTAHMVFRQSRQAIFDETLPSPELYNYDTIEKLADAQKKLNKEKLRVEPTIAEASELRASAMMLYAAMEENYEPVPVTEVEPLSDPPYAAAAHSVCS